MLLQSLYPWRTPVRESHALAVPRTVVRRRPGPLNPALKRSSALVQPSLQPRSMLNHHALAHRIMPKAFHRTSLAAKPLPSRPHPPLKLRLCGLRQLGHTQTTPTAGHSRGLRCRWDNHQSHLLDRMWARVEECVLRVQLSRSGPLLPRNSALLLRHRVSGTRHLLNPIRTAMVTQTVMPLIEHKTVATCR